MVSVSLHRFYESTKEDGRDKGWVQRRLQKALSLSSHSIVIQETSHCSVFVMWPAPFSCQCWVDGVGLHMREDSKHHQ